MSVNPKGSISRHLTHPNLANAESDNGIKLPFSIIKIKQSFEIPKNTRKTRRSNAEINDNCPANLVKIWVKKGE